MITSTHVFTCDRCQATESVPGDEYVMPMLPSGWAVTTATSEAGESYSHLCPTCKTDFQAWVDSYGS